MKNAKILIVEDNDDLLFTLNQVLKKEGYKLFSAASGEEAVKIFNNELIDLVLLDLRLPKMNGIEVLQKIKERDPDILVLMMTASTDPKPAIQPGRRILTVRSVEAGLAVMSPDR